MKTGLVVSAHPGDFVWRAGGAIALHAKINLRPFPGSSLHKAVAKCLGVDTETEEQLVLETTPGRVFFNSALPKGFRFVNDVVGKRNIPIGGITRRSGRKNQSVTGYAHRTHGENWPKPSHDAITRTMSANCRKSTAQWMPRRTSGMTPPCEAAASSNTVCRT